MVAVAATICNPGRLGDNRRLAASSRLNKKAALLPKHRFVNVSFIKN